MHYKFHYPRKTGERLPSNIGGLPKPLHQAIAEAAAKDKLTLAQYLAALMDFKKEFEEHYAPELTAMAAVKKIRKRR
tara:strand:+ start:1785 stop:2015 length:231 start_codon:yes stop_codon:yes gene_type:complete